MNDKDLEYRITKFREILNLVWSSLTEIQLTDQTGSFCEDWLQANWELVVEGVLAHERVTLEVYGDGADCNRVGSRVLYPEKLATHRVICIPKYDAGVVEKISQRVLHRTNALLVFDRFVTFSNERGPVEEPPFDQVLCYSQDQAIVLDVKDVSFMVVEI